MLDVTIGLTALWREEGRCRVQKEKLKCNDRCQVNTLHTCVVF